MSTFDQIGAKIIKEQESIIGPLAWSEAEKVQGLHVVNKKTWDVTVDGANYGSVIDSLVHRYERLFGRASHEVCKEAVASLLAELPSSEVPTSLR